MEEFLSSHDFATDIIKKPGFHGPVQSPVQSSVPTPVQGPVWGPVQDLIVRRALKDSAKWSRPFMDIQTSVDIFRLVPR